MPLQINAKKEIDALESLREIRNMLEKRSRNLEKKKNKLDVYKDKWDKGEKLNEDQTKAVERLDGVSKQIEIVVELQNQVATALDACEKSGKKKEKRDRYEKERQDVSSFARLTEIQTMLQEIDEIREYFPTGEHGTVCLTETELGLLDDLYKTLNPSRSVGETGATYSERLRQTGEFVVNLLEGRDRPSNMAALTAKVTEGDTVEDSASSTTYKELKDLVDKVLACEYFTGEKIVIENEPTEEVDELPEETAEVSEVLCEPAETRSSNLVNGDAGLVVDENVTAVDNFTESSESEEPIANGTDAEEESTSVVQSRPIASWSEVAAADGDKKNNSGLSDMIDHLQSNYTFLVESRLDSTTPTNPSPPTQQMFSEQPVQHQVAAPKSSTTAPIPVPAKKSTWADDSDVNASGSWADEPLLFDAHSPANAPVAGSQETRGHGGPEVDIFASASQSDYLQSGGDEGEDGGGSWQQQHPRSSGHRGGGGRGAFRRDRERGGGGGSRVFRGSRGGGPYRGGRGGNWSNERGGNDRGWNNNRGGGNSGSGGYRGRGGGGSYRGGSDNYRGYRPNFEYTATSGSNF